MKRLFLIGFIFLGLVGCDDLAELNKDIKNPQEVPAGALIANAEKALFDFMTSTNVNVNNFRLWAQQWAQTTYADESNYNLVERNVNGRTFNTLYQGIIRDLKDAKGFIAENGNLTDAQKANQIAIADVIEIFAWHVAVDIFGDIPYSEAFDVTVNLPAYDDDQAIYTDLFNRLNTAIGALSGSSALDTYDLVYGGDTGMWRMFANSLKLRMAIRIADVDAAKSEAMAEEAYADGVIMDMANNFALQYQSGTPNTNPLWVDLVQTGRSDFIITSTIVDPMNAKDDPRRDDYFRDTYGGEYVGGVYGDNNAYNAFSHPGNLQIDPTFPGIIMSSWEVAFLLADAKERGYDVGTMTAEEYYNMGVTHSILYWGGTQAEADAYLAQPEVAYTTAAGTAFEVIAYEKWIALYDQGFEAWSSYRFYDAPTLPIAAQAMIPTPKRFTYPVSEYSLNEENVRSVDYEDALDSPVFWDVN